MEFPLLVIHFFFVGIPSLYISQQRFITESVDICGANSAAIANSVSFNSFFPHHKHFRFVRSQFHTQVIMLKKPLKRQANTSTIVTEYKNLAETKRLDEDANREKNWKRWGPYLSERQWGTVREDYSPDGAW